MLGQIDYMTHPVTRKKMWRATAYLPGDQVLFDWFSTPDAAMEYVNNHTQLSAMGWS
jgi:hypothetical protein